MIYPRSFLPNRLRSVEKWMNCGLLFLAMAVGYAKGDTVWTGTAGDGVFTNSGNWDNGNPDASVQAIILSNSTSALLIDATSGVAQSLTLQGTGSVNLDISASGYLTVGGISTTQPALSVNGGATVNVSGGTVQVDQVGKIQVGDSAGNGTLNLLSGTLNYAVPLSTATGYAYMVVGRDGAVGVVNQSGSSSAIAGGALIIGVDSGTGSYTLSDNSTLTSNSTWNGTTGSTHIYIGLNQSSGQTGTTGTLTLSGNSSFILDSKSYLFVGDNIDNGTAFAGGNGKIVQQDNSTVSLAGTVSIGNSYGSTGEYDQSGGTMTASHRILVGNSGTGTYNLSGGTAAFNGGLTIGASSTSTGVVNVLGGVMQVGGTNGIDGNGSLNFGGGTVQITNSDLTTAIATTVAASTTSTIDTAGLNATWSGQITGPGALLKTGAGRLTLNGTSSSTIGQFSATGGTTAIASTITADGGSFVPTTPHSSSGQRNAFLISGGAQVDLQSGANVTVKNDNNTAFFRVGYGAGQSGILTVTTGASLTVGEASRYANFIVGDGIGATGTVTQSGGEVTVLG